MPGRYTGNNKGGSPKKKQKWSSPTKGTSGIANTPDDPRPQNRVWLGEPCRSNQKLPGPSKPNYLFQLPPELHLQIIGYLHGEDLLSIRESCLGFYGIFQDSTSGHLWDVVRRDAGMLPTDKPLLLPTFDEKEPSIPTLPLPTPDRKQFNLPTPNNQQPTSKPDEKKTPVEKWQPLPTLDQVRVAKYVLQSHCMSCKARKAYPQWELGFRLCETCLEPRLISNQDFNELYWDTFNRKEQAKEAMGWFHPCSIPGVEAREVFRISSPQKWAITAAEKVKSRLRMDPKGSAVELGNETADWLTKTRSFCSEILGSLVVPDRSNQAAFNRLARQRQRWISELILRLVPLKFVPEDIPAMDEVDSWSRFIYKPVAAGIFEEWQKSEIRLLGIVKDRRNARLAPLFQGKPPPTACDGRSLLQISPSSIVAHLGPFPSDIFLKICSMTDPKTLYILEQVSCSAKDILRSPLAEGVWRQARLSLGLESKFPGWKERAFVHYAMNRRCAHCSSEGQTLWNFATNLCGNCFSSHVVDLPYAPAVLTGPIKDSLPPIRAASFCNAGWVTCVKKDSSLLSKDYFEGIRSWVCSFSDHARKMIPDDELGRYIRTQNAQFMKVAEDGLKWQRDRDSRHNYMRKSREKFITDKLQAYAPPLHPSQKVRNSSKWDAIVSKPNPMSELEWKRIEHSVLGLVRFH